MTKSNKKRYKLPALLLSVLLHIFLFTRVVSESETIKKFSNLELDLVAAPSRIAPSRIVPESQVEESKVIPDTNRLASKNTVVSKEQIKRGKEGQIRVKPKKVIQAKKRIQAKKIVKAKIQKDRIQKDRIQKERGQEAKSRKEQRKKEEKRGEEKKTKIKTRAKANFSDSASSELSPSPSLNNDSSDPALAGFTKFRAGIETPPQASKSSSYQPFKYLAPGSSTYLPGVSEGEITLLNAKAEQYAVFVRRVAIQVFSALRTKNWASVNYHQARQGRRFAVIEAKMNKQGQLVGTNSTKSSGSTGFDRVLQEAVDTGFWDQNPALSASLDDGNIHFIFKARTWAELAGDPPRERRWLLLSTGLK